MKLYVSCIASEDCFSATHGRTVVWTLLMCSNVNSWDATPSRWRRRATKRFDVLVQQRHLVYEIQCMKCRFNGGKLNNTRQAIYVWRNFKERSSTIIAKEKQGVLYSTTCVCICSLGYPACDAHAPYYILWPAPLYKIFPHYLIKGTVF